MSDQGFYRVLQDVQSKVARSQEALKPYTSAPQTKSMHVIASVPPKLNSAIHSALAELSRPLADGYEQACRDLADENRISWAGTAHEIREVLATTLRTLAPESDVIAESWFKPETKDGKPSHRQRARYILQQRRAGSKEAEVAEQIEVVEQLVSNLVRSTYSRASDAAHRGKSRSEALRILNYFEAFAHDILDLG